MLGGMDIDRRAALKARHRETILAAAHDLVMEQGGDGFNVDQLAERADVARRTVFNHFASLEDVLVQSCLEELSGTVDQVREAVVSATRGTDRRAAFEALAAVLTGADVLTPLLYIWRAVGGFDDAKARPDRLAVIFFRVEADLTGALAQRFDQVDPLEIRVLVGSLVQGLASAAILWAQSLSGQDLVSQDPAGPGARKQWDALLSAVIDQIRTGYA